MRVLTTNSLILAAISLVPSVSAAPHTGSSVDSHSNLAALAQDPGPSSIPNVRRDEVISAESLSRSPFFEPFADLFKNIGMNTISNNIPLTEDQEKVLGTVHDKLVKLADSVSHVSPGLPLSAAASRSLQENQLVDPPAPLIPKPDVMPPDHTHSVQEGSLQNIIHNINKIAPMSAVFGPIIELLQSSGIMDGGPLNDFQKQVLSKVKEVGWEEVPTVHIEHTREEHEDCDHHDDHHSHDEHKRDSKPHGAHRNSHKSPDTQSEDRHTYGSDRGGDHCREPRDGNWDERHEWDDCERHKNGKDRNENSSLVKISLGNSRHP